jgi:RNA polymerase sigma-70 factor (ECF subfamily)
MPVRNNGQQGSLSWSTESGPRGSETLDLGQERYNALEEKRLVELARTEPEAFGELYLRNADRIYTYVFYRVGSVADAEDLTARTFYQALGGIHRYVDKGVPFVAWLYRIAHNLVANHHRNRARWKETSLDQLEIRSTAPVAAGSRVAERPDRIVEITERQRALVSAIRRQPEERQRLLILKFAERLSNEEIGHMMGRTESSIKSLYFRTLRALRADLEARGW